MVDDGKTKRVAREKPMPVVPIVLPEGAAAEARSIEPQPPVCRTDAVTVVDRNEWDEV